MKVVSKILQGLVIETQTDRYQYGLVHGGVTDFDSSLIEMVDIETNQVFAYCTASDLKDWYYELLKEDFAYQMETKQ